MSDGSSVPEPQGSSPEWVTWRALEVLESLTDD